MTSLVMLEEHRAPARQTTGDPEQRTRVSLLDWRQYAECADPCLDPDDWYPDAKDREGVAYARQVCGLCPVRRQCLRAVMDQEGADSARYGIWGGLTPKERAWLQRSLNGRTTVLGAGP